MLQIEDLNIFIRKLLGSNEDLNQIQTIKINDVMMTEGDFVILRNLFRKQVSEIVKNEINNWEEKLINKNIRFK